MAEEKKEKGKTAKKKSEDAGRKKEAPDAAAPVAKKEAAKEGAAAVAQEKTEGAEIPAAKKKKKGRKHVPVGTVYVKATFNNTVVTFTDMSGNTVVWSSAGSAGFKGSRKSTPFAAQIAAEAAAVKARDVGMRSVVVYVNGPGAGRESAVRAIQKSGIRITALRDVTPIPHNGCRPPKRRRV